MSCRNQQPFLRLVVPRRIAGWSSWRPGWIELEPLEGRILLSTAIQSGQTINATLGSPSQLDEFTFSATAGDSINLALGETGNHTFNFNPQVDLYDPDGQRVDGDSGNPGVNLINIPATKSGPY